MSELASILFAFILSSLSLIGSIKLTQVIVTKVTQSKFTLKESFFISIIGLTSISTLLGILFWQSPNDITIKIFFIAIQVLTIINGTFFSKQYLKILFSNKRALLTFGLLFLILCRPVLLLSSLSSLHDWDAFWFWYPKLLAVTHKGYFSAIDNISHSNYISGVISFIGYQIPSFFSPTTKIIAARFLMLIISSFMLNQILKNFKGIFYWFTILFFISGLPLKFINGDQDIMLALFVTYIARTLLLSKEDLSQILFSKRSTLPLMILPTIKNEGFLYFGLYLFAAVTITLFQNNFTKIKKVLTSKFLYISVLFFTIIILKVFFIDYGELISRNSTYVFSTPSIFIDRAWFLFLRLIIYTFKFYPGYYCAAFLSSVLLFSNRRILKKKDLFIISWASTSLIVIFIILCLSNIGFNFKLSTTLHRVTAPSFFLLTYLACLKIFSTRTYFRELWK